MLTNGKAIINWDDLRASAGRSVRDVIEDFSFGNQTVVDVQKLTKGVIEKFPQSETVGKFN